VLTKTNPEKINRNKTIRRLIKKLEYADFRIKLFEYASARDILDIKKGTIMITFQDWYSIYPKKKEPKRAERTWDKVTKKGKDQELAQKIMDATKAQIKDRANKVSRGIWVPDWKHPATWLNAGCWDDELENIDNGQVKNLWKPKPKVKTDKATVGDFINEARRKLR